MQTLRRFALSLVLSSFWVIASSATGQVVINTVNVDSVPVAVAVNSATNKIYVTNLWCTSLPCASAGTVSVIDDGSMDGTASVEVGVYPISVAVNPVTNKIYVANECGDDVNCAGFGTLTIIDGATNNTTTINVGAVPYQVAVNPITNKIYVVNDCGDDVTCSSAGTVTVVDGATNQVTTVGVGVYPYSAAINTVTNQIYVVNNCGEDLSCNSFGTITVIDGVSNGAFDLNVGAYPTDVAVNKVTNGIYVPNNCGNDLSCNSFGTVTFIDGDTFNTDTIDAGGDPYNVAVNAVTNQIYVVNTCGDDLSCLSPGTVTVIDGVTEDTFDVNIGIDPLGIAVDPVANQIYVTNACGDDINCGSLATVSAIDGPSGSVTSVVVGYGAYGVATNATTDRAFVANYGDDTVSVIAGVSNNVPLQFVPVTPCRLVDTRPENGGDGPIPGGVSENFVLPQGGCGIPSSAAAYSLNVTAVPPGRLGFLTIWPTGQDQPVVSTMNSLDGRIKANAAIVPGGYEGAVSVFVNNTSNVLIDVDGYFAPQGGNTLTFHQITPCRVVDTRDPTRGDLGAPSLNGDQERDFPIMESSCIPGGVQPIAYSFNVTAVPRNLGERLGFLTVWPAGDLRPGVSTLNNLTGTIVANAAIVPAGAGGGVAVYPNDDTDLLIDIDGYFSSGQGGGLSLYTKPPCRVIDTRQVGSGQPFSGQIAVNVATSACTPPTNARAYVFNATVVPPGSLGFLTLWPHGQNRPDASTLNAKDGAITSNMAIVPTSDGLIDAYANALTQMILDISSYFAP